MDLRILGPLEVLGQDGPLALGGPKQRAVLAHLILRANHAVAAERLIDDLWGEEPPETARNTLQTYVYRLRKLLGEERIEGRDGSYVLRAFPEEIDAARFEAAVRRAKALASTEPQAAAAAFAEALALWRGPALADLAEEASLRGEIARLEELRLSATEHRIAAEITRGGHSTVVSELEALTARHPLRERMWANLMLALYRLGRQAEALATFERARDALADELGVEPSAELQDLHERILRRDPELDERPPERAAVRPSRIDLPAGTEFAGYRIERPLGRGGMSVVYLAEHAWLQRKVALKLLAPQLAEDERFRERFVRESRLAASLDHPNVIPIYEAGGSGGDLFIAMRYVEGTDLRTLLAEEGALEPARALAIVRQVAAALDAAHEQGLVHRDVKPGNVLIARARGGETGEHVYLSDFGLTKRSASDSGVTGTGQFVGTLDYAAPEQFHGGTPDARTDVYSLGCVLFECLTGAPPFRADNDAGLMYLHLQEAPPAATAARPELPHAIDRVVARAMAKAPDDRYASAGELAAEASRALGVGAERAAGAARSRLWWISAAAALVLAVAAGIGLSVLFEGESPRVRSTGSPEPTVSPGPTPPPPVFRTVGRPLTDEEDRLLTYIPPEVAADCAPLDRAEPLQGELASLVCRTEDVEVLYQLYPTRDQMDEAFQGNVNSHRAEPGECATEHLAVGPYTIEGERAGRVLCYTVERSNAPTLFGPGAGPNQSRIEWTDENTSVYAQAVRNDLSDLSLYTWWLSSPGPLVPGEESVRPKDSPAAVVGAPRDGTYLAAPAQGCAGTESTTCRLHLNGSEYRIIITGDQFDDRGTVLMQKPNAVVFVPTTGVCFGAAFLGGEDDSRPAAFTWSAGSDGLTFEKVRGGECAGPQAFLADGAWTRAPAGTIALADGGEVALMDPGGDESHPITGELATTPNKDPDWSPDGERIVFVGADEHDDLYVMDADGSNVTRLTEEFGNEYDPAWSPDGDRIAFGYDDLGRGIGPGHESGIFESSIVVMDPEIGAWTGLVTRSEEVLGWPAWSPEGDRIVFSGEDRDGYHLYVVDADGTNLREIRSEPNGMFAMPVFWGPDGRIVFWGNEGGRESLWSVRPDGSGIQEFAPGLPPTASTLTVDWSPDGRWVVAAPVHDLTAYTGDPAYVFLISADGRQVFAVAASGYEPSWRPRAPA